MTEISPPAKQGQMMEYTEQTIDSGTLVSRIEQLIDQGRTGAARPLLAAARGLMQPSSGLSLLSARLALGDGMLDDTGTELDLALSVEPDHPGLRKCRAELRYRLGDLDGAARDAAEAVILDRDDPAAKALLGELLLQLGRAADAVACLSEAVAAAPQDIPGRGMLAQARTANGDMDGALATLLEGLRIVPAAAATTTPPSYCVFGVGTSSRRSNSPSRPVSMVPRTPAHSPSKATLCPAWAGGMRRRWRTMRRGSWRRATPISATSPPPEHSPSVPRRRPMTMSGLCSTAPRTNSKPT